MFRMFKQGILKTQNIGVYNTAENALVGNLTQIAAVPLAMGCNSGNSSGVSNFTTAADTLYAVPFVAPMRGGNIAQIITNIISGAGQGLMGIYTNVPNQLDMYPDQLEASTQIYPQVTLDNVQYIQFSPNSNQLYWAVYVTDTGANTQGKSTLGVQHFLGIGESVAANMITGITAAHTFGALPQTFPGGGAFRENLNIPLIKLRWSA